MTSWKPYLLAQSSVQTQKGIVTKHFPSAIRKRKLSDQRGKYVIGSDRSCIH